MEKTALQNVVGHIQQKLSEIGITTVEDLFEASKTYKERRILSQKIAISKEKLFSFINIHDFLRLPAMNIELAKLFDNAGFETVGSLRHLPLEKLTEVLKNSVGENMYVPDGETLKNILTQAEETPLKIFGYDRIHTDEETQENEVEKDVPMMKPKKKKESASVWWKYVLLLLAIAGILFVFHRHIALATAGIISFFGVLIRFFPKLFTSFIPAKTQELCEKSKALFQKWDDKRKMISNTMIVLPIVLGLLSPYFLHRPRPEPIKEKLPPVIQVDAEFEKGLETLKAQYAKKEISREMLLKLLILEKERMTPKDVKGGCFTDAVGSSFEKYICYAKEKGLVQGRSETIFDPTHKVTKAEALKMIYNVFSLPISKVARTSAFKDVKESDWFAPYVAAGEKLEILEKLPNFLPNEPASFKFIDKTISRIMKLQEQKDPS